MNIVHLQDFYLHVNAVYIPPRAVRPGNNRFVLDDTPLAPLDMKSEKIKSYPQAEDSTLHCYVVPLKDFSTPYEQTSLFDIKELTNDQKPTT